MSAASSLLGGAAVYRARVVSLAAVTDGRPHANLVSPTWCPHALTSAPRQVVGLILRPHASVVGLMLRPHALSIGLHANPVGSFSLLPLEPATGAI